MPWVDRDGNELSSWHERFQPSPGQRYMVGHGLRIPPSYENHVKQLAPDLPERIRKGEFTLPLYADLSRLPETERRAIFGLMVGNEGRTRIGVYKALTKAGFDPNRDMLQVPVLEPDAYRHSNSWAGSRVPYWRQWGSGGVIVNWDLRTNLEGLYAAVGAIYGGGAHSSAAASGRYAGRKAAAYALAAPAINIDSKQIQQEKARVYAPLKKQQRSIGWKELNAGIARVMQTYCGEFRSEAALQEGLRILGEIRETEAAAVYAANPHDLAHAVECLSIIMAGEAIIQASLARKASSRLLSFSRLDYPEVDPAEWHKLLSIKLVDGKAAIGELPLDYYLRPPFAPTFEENYARHNGL